MRIGPFFLFVASFALIGILLAGLIVVPTVLKSAVRNSGEVKAVQLSQTTVSDKTAETKVLADEKVHQEKIDQELRALFQTAQTNLVEAKAKLAEAYIHNDNVKSGARQLLKELQSLERDLK